MWDFILEALQTFSSDSHKLVALSILSMVVLCFLLFHRAPWRLQIWAFSILSCVLIGGLFIGLTSPYGQRKQQLDNREQVTPELKLPTSTNVGEPSHTCLSDGSVRCWGSVTRR